jgi:predicted dehydrogenase
MKLAIFGCGDYLRWQLPDLKNSPGVTTAALYDPDRARAAKFAPELGATVADSPEAIFADPTIDTVALFVPPWLRKDLFLRAVAAGKHVLCTKPLAPTTADCAEMQAAAQAADRRAGVLYGRSSDPWFAATRALLASGRLGRLALYRQDWIHAYPRWNSWATDPAKNGGPFMDAMIHNLNAACHLMGDERPVLRHTFFSHRLAHPDLACADTECLVAEFEGGVAHLFITWAADLATHSTAGNDREHIDLFYLVTDRGWRLTKEWRDGQPVIAASREGKTEHIVCPPLAQTPYQAFAAHIESGAPFPQQLATLAQATRDIHLSRPS